MHTKLLYSLTPPCRRTKLLLAFAFLQWESFTWIPSTLASQASRVSSWILERIWSKQSDCKSSSFARWLQLLSVLERVCFTLSRGTLFDSGTEISLSLARQDLNIDSLYFKLRLCRQRYFKKLPFLKGTSTIPSKEFQRDRRECHI